jgi:hypothetical protein
MKENWKKKKNENRKMKEEKIKKIEKQNKKEKIRIIRKMDAGFSKILLLTHEILLLIL